MSSQHILQLFNLILLVFSSHYVTVVVSQTHISSFEHYMNHLACSTLIPTSSFANHHLLTSTIKAGIPE
ncbi:hypothetical protein LENED_011459 [Lentinula edodes]|uniref:Uncharacterized protein n=1 Tax=Lentinula edodes TaxID=5353 RepID=A0A1Q3EQ34_LENED|nr:hypothetical protein LENED_011459 [Lentinula edodes]